MGQRHLNIKKPVVYSVLCLIVWGILGLCGAQLATAKTVTNLLEAQEIAAIRKSRRWKGVQVDNTLALANRWMMYTPQQLRDMVPPASVPRAFDVHFKQDPLHSEEIRKLGKYPWIIDPDKPYKVICPIGGEVYPTNDFDPKNPGSPRDVSSEPYVDNGWGWKDPSDPQKYWFVAYYAHWLWNNHLRPAAVALGRAYIITGDQRYARQAVALLDRIAEEYPQMDYVKQSRYGTEIQPGTYHGRIVNSIWETGMVHDLALAYDFAFEGIDGDPELEKITGKTATKIRHNIEANLLESAARSIYTMDGRIVGNFGMHQSALATIAIVLDNENTHRYLDRVLYATGLGPASYEGIVTGLTNFLFPDGAPHESSPYYNSMWIEQFNRIAELLLHRDINLYQQEPKLQKLFDYPLRIVLGGKFTPNIGDTGGVKSSGVVGWNSDVYATAFQQWGKKAYVIGQQLETKSDNMSGYGLAMLRRDRDSGGMGVSLYYGQGGVHSHYDRLNLELFARGERLLPDLGYPDYMSGYDKKLSGWTAHTVSHNTVLVDAKRQATKRGGRIQAFNDTPTVQYVDVRAEEAYPGVVDRYQRSVAMIEATKARAYVVDVFRVSGGNQHDYSIHGPDGTFTTNHIALSVPQEKGTLAGENVPWGYLYDEPRLEQPGFSGTYEYYQGSGFSYLKNVQQAQPQEPWDADWALPGTNSHLRMTFVPEPHTQVYVADGEPPQNVAGNPSLLKYVLVRNEKDDHDVLQSTFVTILQPYDKDPFITGIQRLTNSGHQASDDVVALRVSHTEGEEMVFQAVDAGASFESEDGLCFRGLLGVVSRTGGGVVRHANLVGGGVLQQGDFHLEAGGSYTGRISAVDYGTATVTVELDADSPVMPDADILTGQRMVIANETHASEYRIKTVKVIGRRQAELVLDEQTLLSGKGEVASVQAQGVSSKTPLPLGQFYLGQRLINPVNGAGATITAFTGHGSSIKLANSIPELKQESTFHIYEFGVGDQFRIASSIHMELQDDGVYKVSSNVDGQVTLWDGSTHVIPPGESLIKAPVVSIQLLQPLSGVEVTGTLTPHFEANIPPDLAVTQVRVHLGDQVVYQGSHLPLPDRIAIDTSAWADGAYPLTVTATDSLGKTSSITVPLQLRNYWSLDTELTKPITSGWLGGTDLTYIYERSEGWEFTTLQTEDFHGDNDRITRTAQSSEYIVWETPALRSWEIVCYTQGSIAAHDMEFAVSADGEQWRTLPSIHQPGPISQAGWQRLTVTGHSDDDQVRFFRVMLRDTAPALLQMGRVTLIGRILPEL